MHRRTPLLLSVCLVATAVVLISPIARAARPFNVQQFMPNDTQSNGGCASAAPACTPDALSDKFDGIDSLAHLTAVTSQDADRVDWFVCPLGMPAAPSNANMSSCGPQIGSDSTGVVPPASTSQVDEAYDINWNIDGSLDHQRRDIVALACIGAGDNLDNPPNCRASVESSIFLEDAQTGTAQNETSSAEFGNYRTQQSCLTQPSSNAPCNAAYKAFPHGSLVPDNGFDFLAFTSTDVNALSWQLNSPADGQQEPSGSAPNNFSGTGSCVQDTTPFTTFTRWRCQLGAADVPDTAEMAISLVDANAIGAQPAGTAGYCNANNSGTITGAHDNCILDVHYAVSIAREPTKIVQTFAPNSASPPANASCANPDTDETSQLGTTEGVIVCLSDQFTDPISAPWTEESSGVGEISACPGTSHDHNPPSPDVDHCHGTTAANGQSTGITVSNAAGPTGDQVLTSCYDPQNLSPNDPNHGCADAAGALKTTLTVHWVTLPTQVFLAYANPTATDPSDPCRTGTTLKANKVGGHDVINVCTFDSNGNPVPTDTSSRSLQWTITLAQSNEPTAVRFTSTPPQETTGTSGQGTAQIEAVHQGDNFINVFLLDANGTVIDDFRIQKQVHDVPGVRNVPTNLTAKKGRKFIRGKAKSVESECQSGRQVTLFRRRKGPDDVVGSDSTNQFGRWGVKTGHRRGTYYARVAASQATDAQTGDQLNCLADQSKDVRRH